MHLGRKKRQSANLCWNGNQHVASKYFATILSYGRKVWGVEEKMLKPGLVKILGGISANWFNNVQEGTLSSICTRLEVIYRRDRSGVRY